LPTNELLLLHSALTACLMRDSIPEMEEPMAKPTVISKPKSCVKRGVFKEKSLRMESKVIAGFSEPDERPQIVRVWRKGKEVQGLRRRS